MAVGAYQNLMTRLGPIVIEVMGVQLSKSLQKSLRPVASQGMGALDAVIQRYQKLGELRKTESAELVLGLVGPILAMTLLSQAGMNRGVSLDLNQHVKRFIIANHP
jgi:cytochrome c biogenesis protein CcdA